jgi:hypothetical protein
MSVNMMAASLRCSVFSDGTKALNQIVAGRKQQTKDTEEFTRRAKLRKCSSSVTRLMPASPKGLLARLPFAKPNQQYGLKD